MTRQHDREAFEAFVAVSGPSLLHTAWLITQDNGHAEDAVQEALSRVASTWPQIRSVPEAYARRSVINAAIDVHRRARSRVTEAELDPQAETLQAAATEVIDLRQALLQGLRALPPRQRMVLVLRFVLDLDEEQTARALGIRPGTVKSTASRGLAAMRQLAPLLALTSERSEAR